MSGPTPYQRQGQINFLGIPDLDIGPTGTGGLMDEGPPHPMQLLQLNPQSLDPDPVVA